MTASGIIRVLIVQPEADVRDYLSRHLRLSGDIVVVGQVDCGESALDLCKQQVVDVVIMDVVMPGLDGLTITQLLRTGFAGVRVLIFTDVDEIELVAVALRAGASGYLRQGTGHQALIEAVRATARGLCTLTEPGIRQLLSQQAEDWREPSEVVPSTAPAASKNYEYELNLCDSLTCREREIMKLVLVGYTSAEIGEQLYISRRTVEKHRANIKSKLGVRNQHELLRLAHRAGLMPLRNSELHPIRPPRLPGNRSPQVANLTRV